MVYSCEWLVYEKSESLYPSMAKTCHISRNYHDVLDSWTSISDIINYYGTNNELLMKYNGIYEILSNMNLIVNFILHFYYQHQDTSLIQVLDQYNILLLN